MVKGRKVRGGAATRIGKHGDVKLVFNLDQEWISRIAKHTAFKPNPNDLKISITITTDGVTSVYGIDHAIWPYLEQREERIHHYDETSHIRLESLSRGAEHFDIKSSTYDNDRSFRPWQARTLIDNEDLREDAEAIYEPINIKRERLSPAFEDEMGEKRSRTEVEPEAESEPSISPGTGNDVIGPERMDEAHDVSDPVCGSSQELPLSSSAMADSLSDIVAQSRGKMLDGYPMHLWRPCQICSWAADSVSTSESGSPSPQATAATNSTTTGPCSRCSRRVAIINQSPSAWFRRVVVLFESRNCEHWIPSLLLVLTCSVAPKYPHSDDSGYRLATFMVCPHTTLRRMLQITAEQFGNFNFTHVWPILEWTRPEYLRYLKLDTNLWDLQTWQGRDDAPGLLELRLLICESQFGDRSENHGVVWIL